MQIFHDIFASPFSVLLLPTASGTSLSPALSSSLDDTSLFRLNFSYSVLLDFFQNNSVQEITNTEILGLARLLSSRDLSRSTDLIVLPSLYSKTLHGVFILALPALRENEREMWNILIPALHSLVKPSIRQVHERLELPASIALLDKHNPNHATSLEKIISSQNAESTALALDHAELRKCIAVELSSLSPARCQDLCIRRLAYSLAETCSTIISSRATTYFITETSRSLSTRILLQYAQEELSVALTGSSEKIARVESIVSVMGAKSWVAELDKDV